MRKKSGFERFADWLDWLDEEDEDEEDEDEEDCFVWASSSLEGSLCLMTRSGVAQFGVQFAGRLSAASVCLYHPSRRVPLVVRLFSVCPPIWSPFPLCVAML